jgi:hypothetical protein
MRIEICCFRFWQFTKHANRPALNFRVGFAHWRLASDRNELGPSQIGFCCCFPGEPITVALP